MKTITATKSDRTRAKIEAAARSLFKERGYDQTTVREIAAAAHIDPAMVIRYFGSKDELFERAAEPNLELPDLTDINPKEVGETLVGHFLDIWDSGSGMPVLLRSATSNEGAAKKLMEIFTRQVFPVVAAAGDPATAPQRAGLVASQLLGLALTRYILKLPPVVSLERDFIIAEVGKTIQRYVALRAT